MAYRILGADFGDFAVLSDKVKASSIGKNQNKIKFATPKGDIHFHEHILRNYLSIIEGNYQIQNDVTIEGKGDNSLLEIQFNLSDKAISYHNKYGIQHLTKARSGNIAFLASEDNQASIFFQKESSYHTFDIHLPVSLLNHYAGESKAFDSFLTQIHKGISANLLPQNVHITPAIYNCIQDIKTCTFEGMTRKIYLESKVYEIIALLYDNIESRTTNNELTALDQEKIHLAASIIRNNLEKPLTILELARQVGINQTKLKTGFKAIFGQTVFGYLQDIRMHQAKRYLLDTQLSVQEISMRLGYQNTSNFSIAFKKIHGYSPIKLRER